MLWHGQAIFAGIERRQVVFLCWMQDSKLGSLRHQFASRPNAHSQTDWAIEDQAKNLNSTARPYDESAFRPLDFTADWLSHLALVIRVFCCSFQCSGTGKRFSNRKETSYRIRKIACYACAGNAGNIFPATDFKGNRWLAIGLHHGTCGIFKPRWRGKRSRQAQPSILRIWQEAHGVKIDLCPSLQNGPWKL